jgi:hypothetical protein
MRMSGETDEIKVVVRTKLVRWCTLLQRGFRPHLLLLHLNVERGYNGGNRKLKLWNQLDSKKQVVSEKNHRCVGHMSPMANAVIIIVPSTSTTIMPNIWLVGI